MHIKVLLLDHYQTSNPDYELNLELMSTCRAFKRQYKLSAEHTQMVEDQIKEMEQNGVIEVADSAEYNSPVFLVSKRDGSKRFIIVLRLTNAITMPHLVALPCISELLDEMLETRPKYITSVDL